MFFTNTKEDINLIGGKATKLLELEIKNTPKFYVLKSSYFTSTNPQKEDLLKAEIEKLFSKHKLYAIRSSASLEDHSNYSFAGIFDSFLNVKKMDILTYLKQVQASKDSPRVKEYCEKHNLDSSKIQMGIIVQEMVKADYSGVINTINPITNNPDEIYLSVTKGYGENLLAGLEDGTNYLLKGSKFVVDGPAILGKKELELIKKLVQIVKNKTKAFQDIEFVIKKKKIYFLQTRDITAYAGFNPHERTLTLDNSNIIESYYGKTSFLTYSFANEVYSQVYEQTLRFMKVRKKIINNLKPTLAKMLYYYEGKIYYNLNNWYYLTSIFPFKSSKGYMENMMGLNSSVAQTKRIKMHLGDVFSFFYQALIKLKRLDSLIVKFETDFEKIIMPYYGKPITGSNEELFNLYRKLETEIIGKFAIPIANDCAVMLYYGLLTKRLAKLNLANEKELLNDAITNAGEVRSADMYYELAAIIKYIKENEQIAADFRKMSAAELLAKYHNEDSKLTQLIKGYIQDFGSRVCDELKLETITLIEDNLLAYELLKKALASEEPVLNIKEEVKLPKQIEKLALKTKHYIKNRERLRLKRTYVYSVVRNIFLAVGNNYYRAQKLDDPRDIFYLTKEELFNLPVEAKSLVATRKKIYAQYHDNYYDRLVFYGNKVLPILPSQSKLSQGIPSGGGVVKAKASVLKEPTDAFLPGSILVTKRTDSGWISLFPLVSGLIVEHGSALSHSFVVARELGIPALVGVKGATNQIKTGDLVLLDGIKGEFKIENN